MDIIASSYASYSLLLIFSVLIFVVHAFLFLFIEVSSSLNKAGKNYLHFKGLLCI